MNHNKKEKTTPPNQRSAPHMHDISNGLNYLSEVKSSSQKTWELFRYFRGEIQHEHTLLLGRVSWYITCQSFLITVYAITYSNSRQPNWFSNLVLPALAIIVSVLAYFMIEGATKTINMWGKLRNELIAVSAAAQPGSGLDSVIIERWRSGANHNDPIHARALWFPRFITIVFIAFWVSISIVSWKCPWLNPLLAGRP